MRLIYRAACVLCRPHGARLCIAHLLYSEDNGVGAERLVEVTLGGELGRYRGFPFAGGERIVGGEAEAGAGVDRQVVGRVEMAFARFEAADGEAYAGQVAGQLQMLAVDGEERMAAGRNAVERLGGRDA